MFVCVCVCVRMCVVIMFFECVQVNIISVFVMTSSLFPLHSQAVMEPHPEVNC